MSGSDADDRRDAARALARGSEVELFSVAGHDGLLREVNVGFASLLDLTPAEVAGRSLLTLVYPDDLEVIVAGLAALEAGAAEVRLECRFTQRDGRGVHLQWVARPVPGTDLWWASGRDTTEFHQLVAERIDLRARLDLAIGQATAAMWELDVRKDCLTWEAQAMSILGVASGSIPGSTAELAAVVDPRDSAAALAALARLVETGFTEVDLRVGDAAGLRHLSLRGKILERNRRGEPVRAVGLLLDISTQKAFEEQMLLMLMRDALTGAPNRRAFDQALRSEWRRCTRSGEPISIVMVDIDNFKRFNDTFGHLVGDAALTAVARTLTAIPSREGDLVARFGGEEFAVVLPGSDEAGAATVAGRLIESVRAITLRQAPDWPLSVSVGTATWRPGDPAERSAQLLGRADEALYAAKAAGKNRTVAYEHSLAERARLEAAIVRGIAAGEFLLHYQPIIDLPSGRVDGFEALVRWNRPGHGLLSPDHFIPIAESSDIICDLGRWVLAEAACQLARWSREGVLDGSPQVAVNVSGRHVCNPIIVADIEAAVAAAGISAARLELEVTETALVDGALANIQFDRIRALGVTVAIDDFGTGHTSIGQLPALQVDVLKIDRSFIASQDPRQVELVTLIIRAAHSFGLRVVAEGMESLETLARLRGLGCDAAQGYAISRPLPADAVGPWLVRWQAEMVPARIAA